MRAADEPAIRPLLAPVVAAPDQSGVAPTARTLSDRSGLYVIWSCARSVVQVAEIPDLGWPQAFPGSAAPRPGNSFASPRSSTGKSAGQLTRWLEVRILPGASHLSKATLRPSVPEPPSFACFPQGARAPLIVGIIRPSAYVYATCRTVRKTPATGRFSSPVENSARTSRCG